MQTIEMIIDTISIDVCILSKCTLYSVQYIIQIINSYIYIYFINFSRVRVQPFLICILYIQTVIDYSSFFIAYK